MKRQILTLSILLAVSQLFGQESRFWVNGSGNWSDQSHWSTVSGGTPGATVPDQNTNVVFDQNSFNDSQNTVKVNQPAYVNSLDAQDATFTVSGKKDITVAGSVNVDANVDFGKLRGDLVLATDGDQTINLAAPLDADIIIDGGNWTLLSDLTTTGNLTINNGTFKSNGNSIACENLISNSDNVVEVDFGTSKIDVNDKWQTLLNNSASIVDASNADLTMLDGVSGNLSIYGNVKLGDVVRQGRSASKVGTDFVVSQVSVSCNVNNTGTHDDGEIIITFSGMTEYYDVYLYRQDGMNLIANPVGQGIAPSQKTYTIGNRTAGKYRVAWCPNGKPSQLSDVKEITVLEPDPIKVEAIVVDEPDCFGEPIKKMQASATGGIGPYTYFWDEYEQGELGTDDYLENLIDGSQVDIYATDANGCKNSIEFQYWSEFPEYSNYVYPFEQITTTLASTQTCEGEASGVITVTPAGGTGIYTSYIATHTTSGIQYSSATNTIENLPEGYYTVVVKDSKGCPSIANTETIEVNPAPVANAGADGGMCETEISYTLNGSASNYQSVEWTTTDGTGTFSNGNALNATYNPSSADRTQGFVTLKLTAEGLAGCDPVDDEMVLTFYTTPAPTVTTADNSKVCGWSTTLEATASQDGTMVWELVSGPGRADFSGSNVTVYADGTYTFRVKETNANGCEGYSSNVNVSLYHSPVATINTGATTLCNNATLNLSGNVEYYSSFAWSCTNGTLGNATSLAPTFTPNAGFSGTAVITLTANGNGVCSPDVKTLNVTVDAAPTPVLVTADGDVCGMTKAISANVATGNTIKWYTRSGGSATFADATSATTDVTATQAGEYKFYFIETTGAGCSTESGDLTLDFYDEPTIDIITADKTICGSEKISLTASSNVVDITWTGGNGTFSPATGTSTTYTPAPSDQGKTIVLTATAHGSGACASEHPSDTYNLTVSQVPNPSLSALSSVCGLETTITIDNALLGSDLAFSKKTGPGNATFSELTQTSVKVEVNQAGSYAFQLVETSNGCTNALPAFVAITFNEAPSIDLGIENDVTCSADPYQLKATATNCKAISWAVSMGEGTFVPSTGANVKFTPVLPDGIDSKDYKILVTGTPSSPVCGAVVDEMLLTVTRTPNPGIVADETNCGFTQSISASNVLAGSTRTWSVVSTPTGGSASFSNANDANTNIIVTAKGSYTIRFTEEFNGCSNYTEKTMIFYEVPSAFAGADATICASDGEYILSDASIHNDEPIAVNPTTWVSSTGSGSFYTNSMEQPVYVPSATEIAAGTVTLIVTTHHQYCGDATDEMVLTITPTPVPEIISAGGADVCGFTNALTGNASYGGTLSWEQIGGPSTATISPKTGSHTNVTVPQEGVYTFKLIEVANGCEGSTTIDIKFNAEPSITLSSLADEICAGDSYTISADIAHCTNVSWSMSGSLGSLGTASLAGTTSTVTYTSVNQTTPYNVTLTATPVGGCNTNGAKSMVLTVNGTPAPAIADATACGLTYNATAVQTVSGSEMHWSSNDAVTFSDPDKPTTDIIATAGGTYTVRLTEKSGSCNDYAEASITFVEEPIVDAGATDAICADQASYTVDDASAVNYSSLLWTSNGNGSFADASVLNPTYNIGSADIAAGSVTLTLTAYPNAPCTTPVTSTKTITINPLPVPTVAGENSVCLNSVQTYTTETGMTGYMWTIAGGNIISGEETASVTVEWTSAGSQTISVSYANDNGCSAATATDYVVMVNTLPNIGLADMNSCTNSNVVLYGNVTSGAAPYVHAWTGDVANLSATDVIDPIFESTIAGTYSFTYTVTDANGCVATKDITVENIQGPSAFAGADAVVCYASDYTLADATAENYSSIVWSTSGDGEFDDKYALNPTYTPGANDLTNGTATLTMEAQSMSCGSAFDDVVLTINPEMGVAIGSITPFLISESTKIEVSLWLTHEHFGYVGFYLVSPDGTEVKLYNHREDIAGSASPVMRNKTMDGLKFSTESETALDLRALTAPYTGTFDITDAAKWTNIYGKDPAEGGWSVVAKSVFGDAVGTLTRATISFTDINRQGVMQTIMFDSKTISNPILAHRETRYIVPMGLRTSCYGTCDARAVVNVIGGSGEFNSFVWSDPSILGTDTVDLCAGDFTVTVTDSYGCTASGSITVLSPDPIVLNATGTDVMCYGGNDGSASVVATQGVGEYSYEWNEVDTLNTKDIDNLVAGTYIVKVTDENSCWSMDTVEISQPASALNIDNIDVTISSCTGVDGSIAFALSGGVEPYYVTCPTALFVDGAATGLASDDYMVHIEDANGCSIDTLVSTKPAGMVLTITKKDILCNGGDNGSLSVVVEGGMADFTYSWVDAENIVISEESSAENLKAGSYGLLVVDANGCQASDYSLVLDEPQKLVVTDDVTKASCGGSDGSIELTVSGGVEPYSYLWSNGATTATVSGLTEGVYSVIVTDANMCEAYDTITVNNDSELAVSVDGITNVTNGCNFDGAIDITVTGAYGTPSFYWTNEAGEEVSTAEDPTNLPKGTYYVKVEDEHNCAINETAIVGGVDKFEVKRMIPVDAKCPGSADGTLEPDLTDCGGVAPYTYSWAHDGSTDAKATGLAAGTYTVTVYDANGCESTISGTVGEPAPITADFIMTPSGCSVNTGVLEAVNIKGGNAPYDVMWFESVSSTLVYISMDNPFEEVGAGNYKAVIVDRNECESEAYDVTMVDESNLDVTATVNNLECYNDNSGSVALAVNGGSGNYAFAWSNGATESTATNLQAGDYSVTVTDLTSNCQIAETFTIEQPDAIVPSIVFSKPIRCAGDTEASFYATATGGSGSLVYTWYSEGYVVSNDSIVSNVGEGIYNVMVVDANGCSAFDTVTIVNPDTLKIVEVKTTESDCGDATGTASVTVEGGVGQYSYYWRTLTGDDIVSYEANPSNLGVDIYRLEIIDALGCSVADTIEINDNGTLDFQIKNIIPVPCASYCTGSATIGYVFDDAGNVYDDDSNLQFIWNNDPNDNGRFTNSLCLGTNTVTVINQDGCRKVKEVVITDELALRVANVANYPDLNGGQNCNGELVVSVAGGIGNYSYAWSDVYGNAIESDDTETTTSINKLCEGYYTLHIEDENLSGCSVDTTIAVEHRPLLYQVVKNVPNICFGGNNGALEVVGVGGYYEGYQYKWTSANWPADFVATTASIENLQGGWYVFTISQRQGRASITDSLFVEQPSDRISTMFVTDGSDCHVANGSIRILKTIGGKAPFTYNFSNESWTADSVKNSDNGVTLSGIGVGNYKLRIVDDKGCVQDSIFSIPDNSNFVLNAGVTDLRCFEVPEGGIALSPTSKNGTNFKYLWSTGDSTNSISGLQAGTYSVKVVDDSSCVRMDTFVVTQPDKITFEITDIVSAMCSASNEATITLDSICGGRDIESCLVGDSIFDIKGKASPITLSGIASGKYSVIVEENNGGCQSDPIDIVVGSRYPSFAVSDSIVDASCLNMKADGTLALDGGIILEAMINPFVFSQVSETVLSTSSESTTLDDLWYRIGESKPNNSGVFKGLEAGTYTVTVGYGEDMVCPQEFTATVASKSNFSITEAAFYMNGNNQTSVYTCPDNELSAFVTASTPFSYRFYAAYDENAEPAELPIVSPVDTAPAPADTTVIDSTFADSTLAYINRFRTIRYAADSISGDSASVDTTVIVPVVETPKYKLDTVGGVVYVVFGEGDNVSAGQKGWVDNFLPYGTETYYYFMAKDGICMDIDSIKATAMNPVYKLRATISMDDAGPGDLLIDGVYEVAEGARIQLDANDLEFDFNETIYVENGWTWGAAPVDDKSSNAGIKPESTLNDNPIAVQPYGNLMIKVRDSVAFNVYSIDTTLVCYYYDSVRLNSLNGIRPAEVFTPNADGHNDIWRIEGLSSYDKVTIYVFNRWGGRVWQYSGSGRDYSANQWDGRNEKDKPVPSGTYYYVIQCSDDVLGGKKTTGPVTILR